jgi:hypothetical protein
VSIPKDGNFRDLSCQLGGLRLNGIVKYQEDTVSPTPTCGTAQSLIFATIDDPAVVQNINVSDNPIGWLQVKIGNVNSIGNGDFTKPFYIPLYQ